MISASGYGKGISLVLRRSEMPLHQPRDRVELVVARESSRDKQYKLYALDNGASRDVHFVVNQLRTVKHERFLVISLRKYGFEEFAKDYETKPEDFENTNLVVNNSSVCLRLDGIDANLKHPRL